MIEETLIKLSKALAKEYQIENLCLTGGVMLNCVANGLLLRDAAFENIWVQPASGDAGGALGAALFKWHQELDQGRGPLEKLGQVRSTIPAVTYVDFSLRIQTVHVDTNPLYHFLISRFKSLTGCPILVNNLFNVRGEPIVHSPEDAFWCFMGTDLKMLAIGNCHLNNEKQTEALSVSYESLYELD